VAGVRQPASPRRSQRVCSGKPAADARRLSIAKDKVSLGEASSSFVSTSPDAHIATVHIRELRLFGPPALPRSFCCLYLVVCHELYLHICSRWVSCVRASRRIAADPPTRRSIPMIAPEPASANPLPNPKSSDAARPPPATSPRSEHSKCLECLRACVTGPLTVHKLSVTA
jgi:hypothetical protein